MKQNSTDEWLFWATEKCKEAMLNGLTLELHRDANGMTTMRVTTMRPNQGSRAEDQAKGRRLFQPMIRDDKSRIKKLVGLRGHASGVSES